MLAGCIVLAALALPLGLALLGMDYLSARNSLATTVPLAVALGTGFAVFGRIGRSSLVGLVALSLAVAVTDAGQPKFHSEDWRSAAEDLGRSTHTRAGAGPARARRAARERSTPLGGRSQPGVIRRPPIASRAACPGARRAQTPDRAVRTSS